MAADAFTKELYQSVHKYFKENNISRFADNIMRIKVIGSAIWWLSSVILLFTLDLPFWGQVGLYFFHALSQIYIALNIGHDANHYCVFKNKRLSRLLTYSYDLVGVSSYMWRELHDSQHHNVMNIQGKDENLHARNLLRYTKFRKHRPWHRFQHIYVYILYMFFTTDWAFTKDLECFFLPYTDRLKQMKHSPKEIAKLFAWKIFFIGYMIALPIVLLGWSVWAVAIIFTLAMAINGVIGASIIQTSHSVKEAEHPASRNEYKHHVYHIFATTTDYAVNSKWAFWWTGGLHLHVIHHLCPNVCHTHYPALTRIVKEKAEKYGIDYHVNSSIWTAIGSHLEFFKEMSIPGPTEPMDADRKEKNRAVATPA